MVDAIPFTAYAKIIPNRGSGRRFEAVRSREKIASLIYNDLVSVFAGNIAQPGGSGTCTLTSDPASFSEDCKIVAVTPQFGQAPDRVTIVGFFPGLGIVPYPQITIIHCGQYVTGPASGAPGWRPELNPTAANIQDVMDLKAALEASVTHASMTIFKMEVAGVTYGQGGYHFPR